MLEVFTIIRHMQSADQKAAFIAPVYNTTFSNIHLKYPCNADISKIHANCN